MSLIEFVSFLPFKNDFLISPSLNVPKNFQAMTKFSFDQKTISIKNILHPFQPLSMKEIDEFVQSMKNMKVFV